MEDEKVRKTSLRDYLMCSFMHGETWSFQLLLLPGKDLKQEMETGVNATDDGLAVFLSELPSQA